MKNMTLKAGIVALTLIFSSCFSMGDSDREPELAVVNPETDSLIFIHIDLNILFRFSPAPDSVSIARVVPSIGFGRPMYQDGQLFYINGLRPNAIYRMLNYIYSETSGRTTYTNTVWFGLQGQSPYVVNNNKPGIYFLGSYKRGARGLERQDSPTEYELLEKLLWHYGGHPALKRRIEARMGELK